MPYNRRPRKRTPYRKRAVPEKRIRTVVKSELKKEIEQKWYDRSSTGSAEYTVLAVVDPLLNFARGTSVNNYIGSNIKVNSMEIRGQLIAQDAPGNTVRMVIIQDKSTSPASGPTAGTLFNTAVNPGMYAPFNKDYMDTYTLIKDKTFLLTNDGASSTGYLPRNFKFIIKGKRLRQIKFTAGGAIDSNHIWICFISDSTVATHPAWGMTIRTNYTDA